MKLNKFVINFSYVDGDLIKITVFDSDNILSYTLPILLPIENLKQFEKLISDIPKEDKDFNIEYFCQILSGAIVYAHKG